MNAAKDYSSETGQRELAAGVLKQATQDLRRFQAFAQKWYLILRAVVRESNYRHDLLINSLTAFNFRRALILECTGERLARSGANPR